MFDLKRTGAFIVCGLCAVRAMACSPNSAGGSTIGFVSAGGSVATTGGAPGSAAQTGSSGTWSAAGSTGTGSSGGIFHIKDGGTVRTHDSSCGAVAEVPDQIIVYTEASITDTYTTPAPVAIFIMQDRSGSMVTGRPPPASPMSWDNSASAIGSFVMDPLSAGIDIGLGTFPYGPNNTADCAAGTDCGMPVVPIAPLPGNQQAMIDAMTAQRPVPNSMANTPTECALRGMINTCLTYHAASPSGEQCVAVLVTDGNPTFCDTTQQNLIAIIADGHMKGIDTYALALPGTNIDTMNSYAQAGGTGQAIDVSGGAMAFVAALNAIRGKITHQVSHTVVTTHVTQTPLKCQWKIPQQKQGDPPLDPEKVNLQFTPPNGPPTQFGHVAGASACPPNQNAWYFDDEKTPTQVFLCPNTCTNVEQVMNARIDILLHCPRIEAPPA